MKRYDYEVAINQLNLGKKQRLNTIQHKGEIPDFAKTSDFVDLFLPYLKIIGDSREQNHWIEQACAYYGIAFERAVKDRKAGTENLKEGDYTFQVIFGNRTFDYTGRVAYERKGSVCEFYNNLMERNRIEREFERFAEKGYKKVVLMLEFGETLPDLINMTFSYRAEGGALETKCVYRTIYSAVMSWKQPNNKDFDILQSNSRKKLFWLVLQDMYYYFRNELRIECLREGLLKSESEKENPTKEPQNAIGRNYNVERNTEIENA